MSSKEYTSEVQDDSLRRKGPPYGLIKIPKAPSLPILGSLPYIFRKKLDFFTDTRQRCGDIYFLWMGPQKVLVCNHPDHVRHIFIDNQPKYLKEGPWNIVRTLLAGDGHGTVGTAEGEFWRYQRRMMSELFTRKHGLSQASLIVDAIDDSISKWDVGNDYIAIDIMPVLTDTVNNIVIQSMFGGSLNRQDAIILNNTLSVLLKGFLLTAITARLPSWMPFPGKSRMRESTAEFERITCRTIDTCRKKGGMDGSLLSLLVSTVDNNANDTMTDGQLRAEIMGLFIGAFETTAITLVWAFDLLAQHPHVYRKLQEEIDIVLGDKKPGATDLQKLKYTEWVIKESMRMYPATYWQMRVAQEDDVIDGRFVSAGTNVVLMSYAVHHHPDFWQNPFIFDPERFSPERSSGRDNMAWIPFGMGPHGCLGGQLAMLELKLTLARVLQQFEMGVQEGRQPAKASIATALKPKLADGVVVLLKKRRRPSHDMQ